MNLLDDGFSLVWVVSGWVLLLAGLVWGFKTAPWQRLRSNTTTQHVFLGATVFVWLAWTFAATIEGGLSFHFLLVSVAVVLVGPQLALWLAVLALLGVTALGYAGWWVFGLNAVLMGLVPVMITWALVHFTFKFLDKNFFVFVLMNGFLAAALSSFTVLMLGGGVMWLSEVHTLEKLTQSFFPYIPMMAIPEGFVSGMLLAALVLFKPSWIGCYSDDLYLKGK